MKFFGYTIGRTKTESADGVTDVVIESEDQAPDVSGRAVVIALLSVFVGASLAVAGVYVLSGLGWALIASAVSCFGFSGVMLRGLSRGD